MFGAILVNIQGTTKLNFENIILKDCLPIYRPTTGECVHLVTRGLLRSRDKDGGDTIRSAIAEKPMIHGNIKRGYN